MLFIVGFASLLDIIDKHLLVGARDGVLEHAIGEDFERGRLRNIELLADIHVVVDVNCSEDHIWIRSL